MNKIKKVGYVATGASMLLPLSLLAQGTNSQNISGLGSLVNQFGKILDMLIPIAFGLGLLVFFWGLIQYILSAGDPIKAKAGKSIMIGGVIALFVMSSVWGLTQFIGDIFGVGDQTTAKVPGYR